MSWNKKELKDDVADRAADLIRAILAGPRGLSANMTKALEEALSNPEALRRAGTYLHLEYRRAGSEATLYVDSTDYSSRDYLTDRTVTDAQGNEFEQYRWSFKVNYPCHGSADPATVLARARLIEDVALLAAELQAQHRESDPITRLRRTAEQVEADEAAERAQKAQVAASKILDLNEGLRSMKVGAVKPAGVVDQNLVTGEYVVQRGKRKFLVTVDVTGDNTVVLVTRTE